MVRVLVVDDDRGAAATLAADLRREGHEVMTAADEGEALDAVRRARFDLVVAELAPEGSAPFSLLRRLREQVPIPAEVVERASFAAIVGRSRCMQDLLDLVRRVAATDSTVLITGETGTGKELVARALHSASPRRDRVFCALNSAAFPETLLESELFGHRRGAFTGASQNRRGLLESAHGGTVLLDEVAEMPLAMQAKLLRFLQTGEIRPVGGETGRVVDVRLVTATNKDLEREVRAGRFREDLFYRLAVIPIHVPPLRERAEDVPALALHFLRRFAAKLGKDVGAIDPATLDLLVAHRWPGNVRELENTIERGVALCEAARLEPHDLPDRLHASERAVAENESLHSLQLLERRHILSTLERVGWSRKRAAEVLQISTTTLWRRLKVFGIEAVVVKPPPSSRDAISSAP